MRNWVRPLVWIGLGLLLGAALGLYLGWVAWPTEFVEANPTILEEEYRRDYAVMIAHAYALDGDLDAARRRLASLEREAPDRWLLTQTVDAILAGRDEQTVIMPLVTLSHDLGLNSPAMAPYLHNLEDEANHGDAAEDGAIQRGRAEDGIDVSQ
ncbi:MAG TPA: hypothetical protein VK879_09225 [Candidatus Sulfomarinibacteraceae bacterium]|nr:hypothetical protein [Candidatus Sulfomarinibacteraceae bacterium]